MAIGTLNVNGKLYDFEAENFEKCNNGEGEIIEILTQSKFEALELILWLEKNFEKLCYKLEKTDIVNPFYIISIEPTQEHKLGFHKFVISLENN